MNQALVRALPAYTEKATGNQVQALRIRFLFHSPRGRQVVPVENRYASLEVTEEWVTETGATRGDFIVWEEGRDVRVMKADEFEAAFRPAI